MAPNDLPLRRRVFWTVLAGFLLCVAAVHGVQYALSYDVIAVGENPYGSYGLTLARIPPKSPDVRRAVILSNSVYQGYGVVQHMRRRAEEEGRRLEFVNLAQKGASLSDYVLQAAKAVQVEPDLLVLCLAECTFMQIYPRFRSDMDQAAFDPDVLARVPASFYERHFDLSSAAHSLATTILPANRIDPILRHRLAESRYVPERVKRQLHFPQLNLVADEIAQAQRRGRPAAAGEIEAADAPSAAAFEYYPDLGATWNELMQVLLSADAPLVVILQQNRATERYLALRRQLTSFCSAYPHVTFADLTDEWNSGDYPDRLHPATPFRNAYADRHYAAICQALSE